jgi:hypothetical protein
MSKAAWAPDIRERALAIYLERGTAEASRETGVPKGTIAAWASRNGTATLAPERLARAAQTAEARRELHLAELADDLVTIARDRAKRLRQSITADSEREIAQVMGIAIDKMQLLTGKATVRVEAVEAKQREVLGKLIELRQTA